MKKKSTKPKLTITVPRNLDNTIRRKAFTEKKSFGEIVARFYDAYKKETKKEKE